MDVAQVFQERTQPNDPSKSVVPAPVSVSEAETEKPASRSENDSLGIGKAPQNGMSHSVQPDKRKSSYEKYSAFAMPPVKEETPVATPVGTLSRTTASKIEENPPVLEPSPVNDSLAPSNKSAESEYIQIGLSKSLHLFHIDH